MSKLKLAEVFSSGMVLQRDKPIHIWGTAPDAVSVITSFAGQCICSNVENGKWRGVFPSMSAAVGLELYVRQGDDEIILSNIQVGDVWIAGGQSNMEFFMRYEAHLQEALSLEDNDHIRMYNCPRCAFEGQSLSTPGSGCWFGPKDAQMMYFSAIGYWFSRYLQPEIGVPIGIIGCNWGGTSASAWSASDELENSELSVYLDDYCSAIECSAPQEIEEKSIAGWEFQENEEHKNEWAGVMYGISREEQLYRIRWVKNNPIVPMGPFNKNRPCCLYENMVSKISDFSVKGVLWYQGENDVHHAQLYSKLFSSLIRSWRNAWKDNLAFLFVQLSSFERWLALDGEMFPAIRQQQDIVSVTIPNCWMTTSMDVGMRYDIHPKEKKVLAYRLALLAMDKIYGISCQSEPPTLVALERIQEKIVRLIFKNAHGLNCDNSEMRLFQIYQDGTEKCVGGLEILNNDILLYIPDLCSKPLTVSYAMTPYAVTTLKNSSDIPAKPFQIVLV